MEEMRQITIDEWMQWKEDIREKLKETAENFVHIGYRLKQIRDSGMYGGAADIFEFARKEYGLGKSTVSRFIAINEKFSEGGNSIELMVPYKAIGSSKLAEMLTLTDEECSMITEKTTVSQIRELKEFNRKEPVADEEAGDGQEKSWTPMQKCIIEYFREKKDVLDTAMEQIAVNDYKGAAETINPSGNSTFKKGIVFLFLYEYKDGVKYKIFGGKDIHVLSWDDFIMEICEIFWPYYSVGMNGYEEIYGGPENNAKTAERRNGEGSIATSQQEGKEETGHAGKMEEEKDLEEEAQEDPAETEDDEEDGESGDDADGTGGMDREEQDIETQMAAGVEEEGADDAAMESEAVTQIRGYKAGINSDLRIMQEKYEKQDWTGLIKKAEDIIWRAEQIWKIQNGEERG